MQWFRIFSKLAFICNCCFLAALVIQQLPVQPAGEGVSMVIILGYGAATIINLLMHITGVVLCFSGWRVRTIVPVWLIIVNFLFLIAQLILFFI